MDKPLGLEIDAFDPLLECLLIFNRIYQKNYSKKILLAGLPLENHALTPTVFVRAAARAELHAQIVKRPLAKIPELVLPVLLLLKKNQACILNRWIDKETVSIFLPDSGMIEITKPASELNEVYSGNAIFVYPISQSAPVTMEKAKKPTSWFWGTLWRFRKSYFEVIIAALFINIFTVITPLFTMNVYDRVVPNNAIATLWVLTVGIFLIYTFDLVLRTLRGYLIEVCGKKADVLMASSLFQKIMNIQMTCKPASVGSFSNTLREFESVRDFFTSSSLTTLIDLPFVVIFLFVIYYLGGPLVLIPLTVFPTILIFTLLMEKPLHKQVKEALNVSSQKNAVLIESLSGLETIKTMSAEGLVQKKWENLVAKNARLSLRSRSLSSLVANFTNYSQQLVNVGVVVLGVYAIKEGQLTLGGLIACTILSGRCLAPLGPIANMLVRYQQAKVALEGLNQIMNLSEDRSEDKKFLHRSRLEGAIEFENVTFSYPKQEAEVLKNVSFSIKAGEKVGILGRIGSGKSTLHKILLGLYPPKSGTVSIDGVNLLQLDPIDLRHNVGYVPQECLLFTGTIRDNIIMAKPTATDEEILNIAKITGVDRFVKQHPLGYELPVGERGETLSGGQRQSITIARALLSDPPILLLDEPTNAMDEQTEGELAKELSFFIKDKTFILITHKPFLLSLVDRVILFEAGRIIYDGSKEALLNLNKKQLTN